MSIDNPNKKNFVLGLSVVLFGLLFSVPVHGQSETHFESWLSGNDETSLGAISNLAKEGDFEAQVFLGQLDRDIVPGGTSEYLRAVPEEERDGLLRRSGSTNWLISLTDEEKVAFGELLFGYKLGGDSITTAVQLRAKGEPSSADFLLWSTLMDGDFDQLNQIPEEDSGLTDNDLLVWLRDRLSRSEETLTVKVLIDSPNPDTLAGLLVLDRMSSILRLSAGRTRGVDNLLLVLKGNASGIPETTDTVALNNLLSDLATTDPRLGFLSQLCQNCTENEIDLDCITEALEVLGGYKTLMKVRTPSDTVISASSFNQSERAVITVDNVLRSRLQTYNPALRSSCLQERSTRPLPD